MNLWQLDFLQIVTLLAPAWLPLTVLWSSTARAGVLLWSLPANRPLVSVSYETESSHPRHSQHLPCTRKGAAPTTSNLPLDRNSTAASHLPPASLIRGSAQTQDRACSHHWCPETRHPILELAAREGAGRALPQHFRASPSPHGLSSAERALCLRQGAQLQTLPGYLHYLAKTNSCVPLHTPLQAPLHFSGN